MKKSALFIILSLLLLSCSTIRRHRYEKLFSKESNYDVSGISPSPFAGRWRWILNNEYHVFTIDITEENDSLLIAMGGIFYGGRKIDEVEFDKAGDVIPDLVIPVPKSGNTINTKISALQMFFYWPEPEDYGVYRDISFKLLDSNTLIYKVEGNRRYIPDSAVLIKDLTDEPSKFSKERYNPIVDFENWKEILEQ